MDNMPRRTARAVAVTVPLVLSVALADSASAGTPVTWAPGEGYSTIQVLLIYVGIPLGLVVVIALLASINPGKYADAYPIRPKEQDSTEWFGGPGEVEGDERRSLPAGMESSDSSESDGSEPGGLEPDGSATKPGGGASASW